MPQPLSKSNIHLEKTNLFTFFMQCKHIFNFWKNVFDLGFRTISTEKLLILSVWLSTTWTNCTFSMRHWACLKSYSWSCSIFPGSTYSSFMFPKRPVFPTNVPILTSFSEFPPSSTLLDLSPFYSKILASTDLLIATFTISQLQQESSSFLQPWQHRQSVNYHQPNRFLTPVR